MALIRPLYLMGIGFSIAAAVAFSYALQKDIKPLAVSISISRTPLSSPFYIAEHQGFFKQAG
ncbi:MAG: hypothetical protein V7677_16870, partial [Motiliproteus sp.]